MKDLTTEGFSEFTGNRIMSSNKPIISIAVSGRIGINRAAYRNYLSHYQFVKLLYNSETRVMALKGTNSESPTEGGVCPSHTGLPGG